MKSGVTTVMVNILRYFYMLANEIISDIPATGRTAEDMESLPSRERSYNKNLQVKKSTGPKWFH